MKKLLIIVVSAICFLPGCSLVQKLSPEEQFKKSYPQNAYETFTPTSVKGIYEVYNGGQGYYYFPEGDVVLLGNILSKDGKNLTQESNTKRMTSKLVNLPLDQGLKVGNGKKTVVEFIDPNCHYCRLSFNFFAQRKNDITFYVFFFPLSDDSQKKIRHIFCSKDRVKTFEDVLSGKLDNNAPLNLCSDKEVEDMMKNQSNIAAQAGIRATPMFYIKGQVVSGFNQPAIEKLLTD